MPLSTAENPDPGNPEALSVPETKVKHTRGFWRTSLLLVTSAACGGIAVAIWNRHTLALMRQHGGETTSEHGE